MAVTYKRGYTGRQEAGYEAGATMILTVLLCAVVVVALLISIARACWLLLAELRLARLQQVEAWKEQGIGVTEPYPSPYWDSLRRR